MPQTQREKHHPAPLLAAFKNTRLKGGREKGKSGRREPAPPALGSMGGQWRGIRKGWKARPSAGAMRRKNHRRHPGAFGGASERPLATAHGI